MYRIKLAATLLRDGTAVDLLNGQTITCLERRSREQVQLSLMEAKLSIRTRCLHGSRETSLCGIIMVAEEYHMLYIGDGKMMHALNERFGTLIQDVSYYEKWDTCNYLYAVRRYSD